MAKIKKEEVIDNLTLMHKKHSGIITFKNQPEHGKYDNRLNTPFISFDRYLGGGPQRGKVTTYAGLFSTGKTSMCLSIAAANPEAKILFLDNEYEWGPHSYDWVEQYFGMNPNNLDVIRPSYIEEAAKIVNDGCGIYDIIIIDGMTSIGTMMEHDADMEKGNFSSDARAINKFFRKFKGNMFKTNTAVLITNKVYTGIGQGSATYTPMVENGGHGMGYFPSQKLNLTLSQIKDPKDKSITIGQNVNVTAVKDKITGNRGVKFSLEYLNEEGFDAVSDLIHHASDFGLIEKSGSWYSFRGEKIGQGTGKMKSFLMDNPELMDEIRKDTLDCIYKEREEEVSFEVKEQEEQIKA